MCLTATLEGQLAILCIHESILSGWVHVHAGLLNLLIVDFDDTITQKDTVSTLFNVAIQNAGKVRFTDIAQEA